MQQLEQVTIRDEFNSDYFKLKTSMRLMVEKYKNNMSVLHNDQARAIVRLNFACEEV